ncbi:MAG: hypothetical protein R3C97_02260 [Geminicoccaceae bacterium]
MSERGPKAGGRWMAVTILRVAGIAFANSLRLAVGRHVALTFAGGLVVGLVAFSASPLWVFEGMLLAQILALVVDVDADRIIEGPFDRIDHAGLVAVLALSLQLIIAGLA